MEEKRSVLGIRMGDVLKQSGYATDEQIDAALAYQEANSGIRLGTALVELGYISERQMLKALGIRLNLKVQELSRIQVDLEAVMKVPVQAAERYQILPIKMKAGVLTVLTNDPLNFYGLEDIRQITGMDLELCLCESASLSKGIRYYYAEIEARKAAIKANESQKREQKAARQVTDSEHETPVIQLFYNFMKRAYQSRASDIHIEPYEDKTVVRMRIDGSMTQFVALQKTIHLPLIARIKIMGDMDIAERRLPQDGHFKVEIDGDTVNTRVSVVPTVFGEKAVIRLLSGNYQIDSEDTFGMGPREFSVMKKLLEAPSGLIYLTGPTGSGKTTTLYLILSQLSGRPVNICTIEDPVEKNIDGISQCQVNLQTGITFEKGLRALLRQDPDIIMVGETRDEETAAISVRAAITGHLVLSTLHTNDAVASIIRLEDMGVAPYLLAGSLTGIVAQRLMRKLCPECSQEKDAGEEEWRLLGRKAEKIRTSRGCPFCKGTGYQGRVAIHEILIADSTVRKMISRHADRKEIQEYARTKQGMRTLWECGSELVLNGVTTIEELKKVVYYDEWEAF
ncbi:MAG: type II/IV secretion system protein [Lachnospiraceae bacterium]|nr:type II/IV secretion system protein [Lachnospiraceae bacterium]